MFITISLLILGTTSLIALHNWVQKSRLLSKSIPKIFKNVAQYILLQEWDKATRELYLLRKKGKWGKEPSLFQIQVLQGTGRFNKALQLARTSSRTYPEELLFRLEEGKILLKLERAREALQAFSVCFPIMRTQSDFYSLALAQFKNEQIEESLDTLNAMTIKDGPALALSGDVFYELKSFRKAIELYLLAMNVGYQSHHLCVQLGHAYRRLGNLAEAERVFRKLLDQDQGDILAILGLGACLEERGHYHKAFLIYHCALSYSKDPLLLKKIAHMALKTSKYRLAETFFAQLVQYQAPDAKILFYYAFSLECQKKWQEAEQWYLKLIQLFPAYSQGYRALAWMFGVGLSQTLSQEQGLNFAYWALKLKNDPLSWEILSACSARIGEFEKAYQIQISLSYQDQEAKSRAHRQQCLRKLRKRIPLDDHHILRSHVA